MRIRRRIMAVFMALAMMFAASGMWEMRVYAAAVQFSSNQIVKMDLFQSKEFLGRTGENQR